MLRAIAALVLAGVAGTAQAAWVQLRSYQGNGCAPGTLQLAPAPDGGAFTLLFSSFVASAGWRAPDPAFGHVDCDVVVVVGLAPGETVGVDDLMVHGYLAIEPGGQVIQTLGYYFPAAAVTPALASALYAEPYDGNYDRALSLGGGGTTWAPCGLTEVALRLDSSIVARARAPGRALMTVDSVDKDFKLRVGLARRACAG